MTSLHSDGDDSLPPIHRVGGASRRGAQAFTPRAPPMDGAGSEVAPGLTLPTPPWRCSTPGGAGGHQRSHEGGWVEVTTDGWAEGLSLHFLISKVG